MRHQANIEKPYFSRKLPILVISKTAVREKPGRSTYSYDFSYHLRFGKFSGMLTTTGHTVGSVAVCMLKYRVKTFETDKQHVVSFSNVQISKVSMDFMFHDHLQDTAERHWCTRLRDIVNTTGLISP